MYTFNITISLAWEQSENKYSTGAILYNNHHLIWYKELFPWNSCGNDKRWHTLLLQKRCT